MADLLDDGGSGCFARRFFPGFPQFGRVDRAVAQAGQAGLGIQGNGGDRLVDFVRQPGGHFAQGVEARGVGQQGLLPLGGRRHALLFEGAAHPLGHELDQLAVHGGERRRPGPEAGEVERAVDVAADPDRYAQIGFQLEFQVAGMLAPVAGRGVFEAQRFLGAQGVAAVGVVESEDISWAISPPGVTAWTIS
jgi:hypothetical protein